MRIAVAPTLIALITSATVAHAQLDRRYAEEPTGGLAQPVTPLAGEYDARTVTTNAGGLALLRGPELALQLDLEDPDVATSSGGSGFGAYMATSGGGGLLPKYGLGFGFEWLRPARTQLSPDPGSPFRFTLGFATALGPRAGFGLAWHHFSAAGALEGEDTFDLGLASRFGSHLAVGATLLDVATQPIAGTPVQRRYELEVLTRPLATDRLELALGGRIGETRGDVDGWARLSARVARGIYFVGAAESREVIALQSSPMGVTEDQGRELRVTAGLDFSFGSIGISTVGTGIRNDLGKQHVLGTQLTLRMSSSGPPSLIGRPDHIERVELSGNISARELTSIVMRMRAIARDDTAKAMVVTFDGVDAGWATMQELRDEVRAVKKRKKVFAYMVSGTGRDYFIASAADKIYVDPAGGVRLVGMAGTTLYFRGAFDQVGVTPQFEKIAEYKSAPEQFTEKQPTQTAAKMHNDLYDSLWDQWLTQVADGRHLTKEQVQALVDAGPYTAGDLAADNKLVDAVASPDKIAQLIVTELGTAYSVMSPEADRPDRWTRPGIAVIYVDGDITDGKSQTIPILGRSVAGGETLVAAISAARNDSRVGAIVLRIDSPGGSALASELVSREVFATKGVKPIICSFSDLAASGGYFIAAGCDAIYAEPMTITGSIGIFYGKFDLSGLLAKVGVTTETFKRGKRSDVESYFRPYTDEERAALLDKLKYMYGRFVGAVAEGRKLKKEEVDAVGRGHVYTGAQARPIKLVDKFGGIGDALADAKRRMGIDESTKVTLYELPKLSSSLLGTVTNLLGAQAETSTFELPILKSLMRGLPASLLVSPEGAQARLPYDVSFD